MKPSLAAFIRTSIQRQHTPRLRLSQAGMQCERAMYYAAVGEGEDETSPESLIKMALGSAFDAHALQPQVYCGDGIMFHSQVDIAIEFGNLRIAGHADAVFYRVCASGEWFDMEPIALWDLKCVGEGHLEDDGTFKDGTWEKTEKEAKQEHRSQTNLYAWALGLEQYGVCYVNVNRGFIREHVYSVDDIQAQVDLGQFEEVERHKRLGYPPDRPYEDEENEDGTVTAAMDRWPCAWCRHRGTCYRDQLEAANETESVQAARPQ